MGHEMDTRVSRLLLFVSALAIAGACWGLQVAGLGCFGSVIIIINIIILIPAGRLEAVTRTHTRSHMYILHAVSQSVSQSVGWVGWSVGWPMSMNGGQHISD
jgi:hypothetical protein